MTIRHHQHPALGPVDVYPVGVLASLITIRRALLSHHRHPTAQPWRIRRRVIRNETGRIIRNTRRYIGARDWRALRNSLNGYLAEPRTFPTHMRRCGHGWTRRRALHDLNQHHQGTRP